MGLRDDLDLLLGTLGALDEHGQVLASAARLLASEAEEPSDGKSSVTAVRELRATLAELIERARAGIDDGQDWDFAGTGVAPIRDAAQSVPRNVRPRGRGGRQAAG